MWRRGDVLTPVTFTALLHAWRGRAPGSVGVLSSARRLEGGALAVALALVSLFVFASSDPLRGPLAVVLYVPLLFWAAARFGARGATAAVASVTVLAIVGAGHGRGPFSALAAPDTVLHLQRLLLIVAVPVLLLAAVLAGRRAAGRPRRESDDGARGDDLATIRDVAGEGATRSAQRLLQSTMDALSAHIAILDERGIVIAVNEPWRRFAARGRLPDPHFGVGADYAAVCDRVRGPAAPEAGRVAAALREMLRGDRTDFRLEYRCDGDGERRWFQLRMSRFTSDHDGIRIVLAHENVTDLKQAEAVLRDLTGRLLRLQDEERRRIARELHDGAGQNLVALSMNLARLERLGRGDDRLRAIVADSLALVEQSLQEMRTLSYVLHPPTLDGVGLGSAVRWYVEGFARRSGIEVQLDLSPDTERLPQEIESALFRVIQESLINIHRHSGSGTAAIRLRREAGVVRLHVTDEGAGIVPVLPERGDGQGSFGGGIPGMRERLRQLGGHLDIQSNPRGTTVIAVAPLQVETDAPHLAC